MYLKLYAKLVQMVEVKSCVFDLRMDFSPDKTRNKYYSNSRIFSIFVVIDLKCCASVSQNAVLRPSAKGENLKQN